MDNSGIPGDDKTRVLLVSGFLGAGKTTFLKHVLSWKEDMSDTVVIVNEFGDIGIDGSFLQGEVPDVIELTTGCICCTLAVDLILLLKSLWERFKPRWIIIEASGIADPLSIISIFRENGIEENINSLKVITVLDADCWEMRSIMGDLFHRQIETADIILFNKIDLLDKKLVRKSLEEIHETLPQTQIVPTTFCRIDPESIWLESGLKNRELGAMPDQAHGFHVDDAGYQAFSFQDSRPMNEAAFKRFISELPWEVFRVKGAVHFRDHTMMINFVGGKTEWADWKGEPETRLAFVGWDTDIDEVILKLKGCID